MSIESGNRGEYQNPQLEAVKKYFPELLELKISDAEKIARAKALSTLDEYIKNPSKIFGNNFQKEWRKTFTSDSTVKSVQNHIQKIRENLTKTGNENFWSEIISSPVEGVNPDKSVNFSEIFNTRMSRRMFLEKFIGTKELVKIFPKFSPTKEKLNVLQDDVEKTARFTRILDAIESNDEDVNKNKIMQARQYLETGDFWSAEKNFAPYFEKRYNMSFSQTYASNNSLADSLRKLKYYSESGQIMEEEAQKNLSSPENFSQKEEQLKANIEKRIQSENQNDIKKAEEIYENIIASLPANHPERYAIEQRKEEYLQGLFVMNIFKTEMRDFITKHGSDGMSHLYAKYNDMKGLHGWDNWSDKNADIAGEVGIFVLTTALTFGAGTILNLTAKSLQAMKNIKFVGKAMNATSKIPAGLASADKIAGASKLHTLYMAGKFTVVESSMREFFRAEGEISGFENFLEKLATNTVMFAAFAGMEKFFHLLPKKFGGIDPTKPAMISDTLKLTTGDVAIMQALHAVETGQLDWDWFAAFQALVLRTGMQVAKIFPKTAEKFQEAGGKIPEKGNMETKVETQDSSSKSEIAAENNKIILEAENILKKTINYERPPFTKAQKQAILKAYNIGENGIGNLTLKEVYKPLRAEFNKEEIWILLNEWAAMKTSAKGSINTEKPLETHTKKPEMQENKNFDVQEKKTPESTKNKTSSSENIIVFKPLAIDTARSLSKARMSERFTYIEELLNRKLSLAQKNALIEAHHTGTSGIEKFSQRDLRKRAQILNKAGFSKQAQEIILGRGIIGTLSQNPTLLQKINQNIGIKNKPSVERHHIRTQAEIDAQMLQEKIQSEKNILSNIKNKKAISHEAMWKDRIIDIQNERKALKMFTERDNLYSSVYKILTEKFTGNNGLSKNLNEPVYMEINGRKIMITRTDAKEWKIIEENNAIKNGAADILLTKNTLPEVTKHIRKIISKEYNTQLEALGIKNPETMTAKGFGEKISTTPKNISTKNTSEISIKNLPETSNTLQEFSATDTIPVGQKGQHIKIDGKTYRWSTKDNHWTANNGSGETLIIKPSKTEIWKISNTTPKQDAILLLENLTKESPEPLMKKEKFNDLKKYISDNWSLFGSDVAAIGALFSLARLKSNNPYAPIPEIPANAIQNTESEIIQTTLAPVPVPDLDTLTPEKVAEICIQCLEWELSTIDFKRHSAANNKIILTEKRRNNISLRWTKTPEWKNITAEWNEILNNPPQKLDEKILTSIDKAIKNPNVANVQEFQRCIGMNNSDDTQSQDGILGPNTTRQFKNFIENLKNSAY